MAIRHFTIPLSRKLLNRLAQRQFERRWIGQTIGIDPTLVDTYLNLDSSTEKGPIGRHGSTRKMKPFGQFKQEITIQTYKTDERKKAKNGVH